MRVLAIDTSTTRIVTGVLDYTGDAIATVAEKSVPGQVSHGELLAPNIQEVLFRTRVTPQELDAVVVGLGPGPYTGLRVGIVTGASMADALKIPAYGVCSLDAVAARSSSAVLVVSDARRKEIYYGVYDGRGERVAGPDVGKPDRVLEDVRRFEVATVLNAGADKYLDQLAELGVPIEETFPTAESLLRTALRTDAFGASPEPLTPLYLRRPDAKLPAAQGKSRNTLGGR